MHSVGGESLDEGDSLEELALTAKSDYRLRQVCLSVSPHGRPRIPFDGCSLNLKTGYFFENPSWKFKFR
jgi:hypothetical protein